MFAFFRNLWARIKGFFHKDNDEDDPYNHGGYVDYYGCPNSKKAQKLQLRNKSYR